MLAAVPAQAQPEPAGLDRAVARALQQLLDAAPSHVLDNQPLDLETLRRFYGARGAEPAWAGSGDAAERAKLAVSALAAADLEGLNPTDYHPAALAAPAAPEDAAAAAAHDLVLTDAFLRYAHDMRLGRVAAGRVFDDVGLPAQDFDAAAALEAALKGGGLAGLIAELPPPYAEYARLKDALKRYRELAEKGGWPEIPPGDELTLDSSDPRLVTLRQRLAVEDAALAAVPQHTAKGDLQAALRRFQTRNGLAVDGRIGAKTFAALNVSVGDRVNQIIANMERWRWMPRQVEDRYIAVNAADGELRVMDHGTAILASKVVVGDEKHQSPILRAMAVSITVNPPWNVPPSIAQKEMLPKLKADPSYLERENIVIVHGPAGDPYGVNVNWNAIPEGHFPYRLRQLPGPSNSLGGVKIEMPNPFDVYLHDTPMRRLFARAERNFSHGCIRVEQALPLASLALTGDVAEGLPELKEKIAEGDTRHLAIKMPLPVYVLDWTAIAEADGSVEFRSDVYGRDKRLAEVFAYHSRRLNTPPKAAPAAQEAHQQSG